MKAIAPILSVLATAASALPCMWMGILAVGQFGNLWLETPYLREFPAIVGFWLGLAAAIVFFVVCVRKGLRRAASRYLVLLIGIGLLGGVAEELMLMDNAKSSFPLGYFEVAPLSWVIAGILAARLKRPEDGNVSHAA